MTISTSKVFCTILASILCLTSLTAQEDKLTAQEYKLVRGLRDEAKACIAEQDYEKASEIYLDLASRFSEPVMHAKYILKAADQLMLADEGSDALKLYKDLLEHYSLYISHSHIVPQLRKLAENFVVGKGTFLGLTDKAGAIKIYELIIREAPAAHVTEKDQFRLAELLRQQDRPEEAVVIYQTLIRKQLRNWDARTELAMVLAQLARISDGDGSKTRAALREAKLVLAYKPDHPKADQLKELMKHAYELSAQRLLEQAEFYLIPAHRRPAAARRYLHDVISKYPQSEAAKKATSYLKTHPQMVKLEQQALHPTAPKTTPDTKAEKAEDKTAPAKHKPAFDRPSKINRTGKPAFDTPTKVNRGEKPAFATPSKVDRDDKPAFATPSKVNRSHKPAFSRPTTVRQQKKPAFDKPSVRSDKDKPAFDQPSDYFKLMHGLPGAPKKKKPAFDRPSDYFLKQHGNIKKTDEDDADQPKAPAFQPREIKQRQTPAFQPKAVKKTVEKVVETTEDDDQKPAFDKPTAVKRTQKPAFQPREIKREQAPAFQPKAVKKTVEKVVKTTEDDDQKPAFDGPTAVYRTKKPAFAPRLPRKNSSVPAFAPSTLNHPAKDSGFAPSPMNRPAKKTSYN